MWRGLNRSKFIPSFLGNERIAQALLQAIEANKTNHTLLFAGPAGSGKKTLARAAAKRMFCQTACGNCRDCNMLDKGVHPDFMLISPEGDLVKLEHARQLKSFLSSPPNSASIKVAILEKSHSLTVEAANSLLKILEEPISSAVCILTADSADNVLQTLVSRSQVYNLSSLPIDLVVQVLTDKAASESQARFLACFSGGVLGRALSLLEDPDFWQQRKNMAIELAEVFTRRRDPLQTSENWHTLADRVLDLVEYWLRDMLMLQTIPGYSPVNIDLGSFLTECTASSPLDKTIVLLEACVQARQRISARCNSRLVFDSLLLKMWEV
jgi:DNA polymerase-3 subunit delta'